MKITVDRAEKFFTLGKERIRILDQVSLTVMPGEFVSIIGPSGCGKSTLLGLLAGFYPPDKGMALVDGRFGFMSQRDMLLPWRSVIDNVCLPIEIRDKSSLKIARIKAVELLPLLGLEGFGDSLPSQLSGGMRQRAALLRLIMDDCDFWLMDEPFASVDALTKEDLQDWLWGIRRDFKQGVLFVTHDIDEALRLSDRVLLMSPRPGRIVREFIPPKYTDESVQRNSCAAMKKDIRNTLAQYR